MSGNGNAASDTPLTYHPPLRTIDFFLHDVLQASQRVAPLPSYNELDLTRESVSAQLDGAARFAVETALPLNAAGDREGCTYNSTDHSVKTPAGFKPAFDTFREMGWIGAMGDPEHGGLGLPHYVGVAANDVIVGGFSFSSYGGLAAGAASVLEKLASPEIKALYLPRIYAGDWTGTMCLTEGVAGSSVGNAGTKAAPLDDGSYAISGEKIYITGGEHDLAGNIVHLVLARLPGAPGGTSGLSLFLVPKFLPDAQGKIGERNGVTCDGIEAHKMGIHASSTCVMNFDGAKGFLIGAPNKGMRAMFLMMNDARLKVAIQGLAAAELAHQNAAIYTAGRPQGQRIRDVFMGNRDAPQVPVIEHNNISSELIQMRAEIDGLRALVYETAIMLDIAEKHPDPQTRGDAELYASLLTPVLKSYCTDMGCAYTQLCMQHYGGLGYMGKTGMEQLHRDVIIGTIYEGTNHIQAMDFVFRKAAEIERIFLQPMKKEIDAARSSPALEKHADKLDYALALFRESAAGMMNLAMQGDPESMLVHARDFTKMFGNLAIGRMWLRIIETADAKAQADPSRAAFYEMKRKLGECYIHRMMLPAMMEPAGRISAGTETVVGAMTDAEIMPEGVDLPVPAAA